MQKSTRKIDAKRASRNCSGFDRAYSEIRKSFVRARTKNWQLSAKAVELQSSGNVGS